MVDSDRQLPHPSTELRIHSSSSDSQQRFQCCILGAIVGPSDLAAAPAAAATESQAWLLGVPGFDRDDWNAFPRGAAGSPTAWSASA